MDTGHKKSPGEAKTVAAEKKAATINSNLVRGELGPLSSSAQVFVLILFYIMVT